MENLQFYQKSMENYIGFKIKKQRKPLMIDSIRQNEIILLYIGANWSNACRIFVDHLKRVYEYSSTKEELLEIIYVSCDQSEDEFQIAIENVPWAYIPYKEHGIRDIVTRHFDVVGIPSLLLISEKGVCVSDTCVYDLSMNTEEECIKVWLNKMHQFSNAHY